MLENDFYLVQSVDFSDQSALTAIVTELNKRLSKNYPGGAQTAQCNVIFGVRSYAEAPDIGTEYTTGKYYIYCKHSSDQSSGDILRIEPSRGSASNNPVITQFSKAGYVGMNNGTSDGPNGYNITSGLGAGLYVIIGKKGAAFHSGTDLETSYPTFLADSVSGTPVIVRARQNTTTYPNTMTLSVINPSYPNLGTDSDRVEYTFGANVYRNGNSGRIPSELMLPLQMQTPSPADIITNLFVSGYSTIIPGDFEGEIDLREAETGAVKRYYTYRGYVSLRLNDITS